jgi:hypothetical protein
VERRSNSLIVFDHERMRLDRIGTYLSASKSDEEVALVEPAFMRSSGEFDALKARRLLKGKVRYAPANIVRYPFKPFDIRLAYLDEGIQPLFSRPSPQLLRQRFPGNAFLISRDSADKSPEGPPFYLSALVCDYDFISGHARHFPVRIRDGARLGQAAEATLFDALGDKPVAEQPVANLSRGARSYLRRLKTKDPDQDHRSAALVWKHTLAIGFSAAFLNENAQGLRSDWPRVPLPDSRRALEASAELGTRIAELLDTESSVKGLTSGTIAAESRVIAALTRVPKTPLDLSLTAGWGHAGKGAVTMPGTGKLHQRDYTPPERQAIEQGAKALGLTLQDALRQLGTTTCDVYLNDTAYWQNVPANVWSYVIGGYQVIKKWLSYRERDVLGRALTMDEARAVTNTARRIAAILLLQPELDANYQEAKASAYEWQQSGSPEES